VLSITGLACTFSDCATSSGTTGANHSEDKTKLHRSLREPPWMDGVEKSIAILQEV
jgi:hypothetical protein